MKIHTKIFLYFFILILFLYSKYAKVNSVNPLYLNFTKMNGYFEEINGNKYLRLVPTNESKEKI